MTKSKKERPIILVRNIHLDALGGAETYQISLAKELRRNHHPVIIVSSSKPLRAAAKKQKFKTLRGCYLPHQNWSGYRNLFLPLYALWQIVLFLWYIGVIIRFRPQALHLQNRDDMIAGTLAGALTRTRVLWTDHSDLRLVIWENVDKKFKNPIGKFILLLARLPHKITTISDYEYNYVTKLIAPRALPNFIVIKNGVDDRKDQYRGTGVKPQSICHVGRIVDYKGIKELVDAFLQISPDFPSATLDFYGDGPDLPLFKAYIAGNPKIRFRGYTARPLVAIARSEIFVLASYHEGLSLSLLDAAMLEKPIIATNIDGNPEVVKDKETGLLIPMKDADALAEALRALLNSPQTAAKYARAARKLYRTEYNFARIVKLQMEPLYYEES